MKAFATAASLIALLGAGVVLAQQFTPPTFEGLDTNKDGKLSKEEVAAFFAGFTGGGGQGPNVDQIFARWDKDGDGSVSKEEFETRPRPQRGGGGPPPQN